MSLSRTTLRTITILFLIAGILLLRKPVFGQTNVTSSQIQVSHPFAVSSRSGDPNEGSCSLGSGRMGYSRRQARTELLTPNCYFLKAILDEKQANSTHPLFN